jgi:hypothetical protein
MTGYNPAPLAAERARENATAFDWAETDAAKALIARYLWVDELYDRVAGRELPGVEEGLWNELEGIHAELDAIRDDRIADEIASLSERDQENDYLCEAIEESAPSVTTVLDAARKAARDAERWAA